MIHNQQKKLTMKQIFLTIVAFAMCAGANAQTSFTLTQILDSARQNNIAIRQGQRDIAAAQETRRQAFTKNFPTVSALGGWFNSEKSIISSDVNIGKSLSANSDLYQALAAQLPAEALTALSSPISINLVKDGLLGGVTAVQPVFAGGRIINSNRLARVSEQVSGLRLRLSQDEVDKQAEAYFWQMVTLQEKMKTLLSVESLLADIHKDVDVSVRAGVTLRNDLLQVELRQNNIQSQKLKVNNGIMLVRLLLAQYCGLNDTAFVLKYDTTATAPLSLRQDHQAALPLTAEYQLLGKQVEAARLQQKLTLGQNLPSLGVGAGVNYNNVIHSRTNAMIFATLSVPISEWWGGTHAVRRSKIEYQKAVDAQTDQSQLLIIRMQNAWNNVVEAYKQLGIARRSIEQSTENLRLNRDFYRAGTTTMSDLLDAQYLYQQSMDQHTQAFADYQNSILAYRQAVGVH